MPCKSSRPFEITAASADSGLNQLRLTNETDLSFRLEELLDVRFQQSVIIGPVLDQTLIVERKRRGLQSNTGPNFAVINALKDIVGLGNEAANGGALTYLSRPTFESQSSLILSRFEGNRGAATVFVPTPLTWGW